LVDTGDSPKIPFRYCESSLVRIMLTFDLELISGLAFSHAQQFPIIIMQNPNITCNNRNDAETKMIPNVDLNILFLLASRGSTFLRLLRRFYNCSPYSALNSVDHFLRLVSVFRLDVVL
jgi:hypothetical protein